MIASHRRPWRDLSWLTNTLTILAVLVAVAAIVGALYAIAHSGRALILPLLAAGAVPFAARSLAGRVGLALIVGDVVARWLTP